MTNESNDQAKDGQWARRHGILYNVEMSALYHQKRERFFELWDKLSKAFSLLGGSAALYKSADASVVSIVAVLITGASALSLVLGFSERSRRHSELSREFKSLAAQIVEKGPFDFTDGDMNLWEAAKFRLETKEPPALGLLVLLCQNELAIAHNQPNKVVRVGICRRILANFIDLPAPTPGR